MAFSSRDDGKRRLEATAASVVVNELSLLQEITEKKASVEARAREDA
jgi:hypothetical protein